MTAFIPELIYTWTQNTFTLYARKYNWKSDHFWSLMIRLLPSEQYLTWQKSFWSGSQVACCHFHVGYACVYLYMWVCDTLKIEPASKLHAALSLISPKLYYESMLSLKSIQKSRWISLSYKEQLLLHRSYEMCGKRVPFPGLGSSQAPAFAFLYQEVWANCCLSCLEPGQGREGSQALSYGRALLSRLWSENRLSRTLG